MESRELEKYLHSHIPLTRAMQVSVVTLNPDYIVLHAPLAPNINHRETVFGGSAATLATLAAWALVHTRLIDSGRESRVVIQRNSMEFSRPIRGDFTAQSCLSSGQAWQPFLRMLDRKGLARISVSTELSFEQQSAGKFEGDFVALSQDNR